MIQKILLIISIVFLYSSCSTEKSISHMDYPLLNESDNLFIEAFNKDEREKVEYFSRAAVLLEEAIQEYNLDNGYIYYNLANAWFLAGHTGKAILNYRKAEKRLPANNNVKNNLNVARGEVTDNIRQNNGNPLLRTLLFVHYDSSFKVKFVSLILFILLLSASGIFLLFKKSKILKNAMYILTILSVFLIGSIIITASENPEGVIIVPEIVGRKGDSDGYESSFTSPLHEGVEFIKLSERTGWYHIEIADGRQCWIPEYSVQIID